MSNNGQQPKDPEREQGWQEGTKGFHLQQSPSATDGGFEGKKGWKLVHLENTSQNRTFRVQADTTEEVMSGIFHEVPGLFDFNLGIQLFSKPIGNDTRQPVETISALSELWATVYLRKHNG
jgi:hypothetical protein